MAHLRTVVAATSLLAFAAVTSLHADVKTEGRRKPNWAACSRRSPACWVAAVGDEGALSTIAVKGSRQSMMTDFAGRIIDLAEEKVYQLDLKRKTYRVATFAEIRQQMEEARAKAKKRCARSRQIPRSKGSRGGDAKAQGLDGGRPRRPKDGSVADHQRINTNQVLVVVTIREKGKMLEQSGGLQITSDMWMAPQMAAMKEITDFQMYMHRSWPDRWSPARRRRTWPRCWRSTR